MRQSLIKNLAVILAFAIPPLAVAQQLDIVQIMGQFVQVSYASSRCAKPDQEKLANFLKNFNIVYTRGTEELKKRNPTKSEHQVLQGLKQSVAAVEKAIDEVIRDKGCNDPRIQDLVQRFDMQANLKL